MTMEGEFSSLCDLGPISAPFDSICSVRDTPFSWRRGVCVCAAKELAMKFNIFYESGPSESHE